MGQRNIEDIVLAKIAGQELTESETALFDGWYADEANRLYYESLLRVRSGIVATEAAKIDSAKAWGKIIPPVRRPSLTKRVLRYAAAIVLPLSIGAAYLIYQDRQAAVIENIVVKPGEGRAFFSSSSGQRYMLTDRDETIVDETGEIKVYGDPKAVSDFASCAGDSRIINTIEVPRGGYWSVVLDDGSRVWLNCDSRLNFPQNFDGGHRTVEVQGEAYFQVARDESRPFIVKTGDYEIRVTGTEFNVSSYGKGATATTLVEGGVEIVMNGTVSILTPGRRAIIENGAIQTHDVNVGRYVAWRDDEFRYSRTPLEEIIDELARWYDLDVEWKDNGAKRYHFSAGFSRRSELRDILEVLEKTNSVEMTLRGRTLIIKDK